MHSTKIYDSDGFQIDTLEINDDIDFVDGRVSKGTKGWYKGIGIPYNTHFIDVTSSIDTSKYAVIEQSDIFYMGPRVSKRSFEGKSGIFQEKYQPQFEDFIGTCGVKELAIIENSIDFEKSSVDVIKSTRYDESNFQYYFLLNYRCNRVSYIQRGNSKKLYELLEYMICNDWNFIWDKRTIDDISHSGLVTDVADIFRSSLLKHKLGTVYSVLYSLGKTDKRLYDLFLRYTKLQHKSDMDYLFNVIVLLERLGVDCSSLGPNFSSATYKHVVYEHLIEGKNCGDCSFVGLGDQIREGYKQQTAAQLNIRC